MPGPNPRVALVTGCSSGIGRATALRLHEAGFLVYATARNPDQIKDLAAAGMRTLRLDVAQDASMVSAVEQITAEADGVDVLVNNAGLKVLGPVEEVPTEAIRRQLEVNTVGPTRLAQLVLPGMRTRGSGRIINLSSVYGRFAVPGGAYPAAANHAMTAFNDALRQEVSRFGIKVVLIEPAATRGTRLHLNAIEAGESTDSPYAKFNTDVIRWHTQAIGDRPPYNIAGRFSITTDDVGRAITRAATMSRPPRRYPVGFLARSLFILRRWLPEWGFDLFIRFNFPLPGPTAAPGKRVPASR